MKKKRTFRQKRRKLTFKRKSRRIGKKRKRSIFSRRGGIRL